MTYYDILDSAITAVCEDVAASQSIEDYIARGQFLMAGFVVQYAKLDGIYREANGMEPKTIDTDIVTVDPYDDFPLCSVFTPVAINYLASGLVLDESEEMSDKFFDRYINGILEIKKELPAKQTPIIDRYGLK